MISEVVASNNDSLLDGDGVSSDWIELYNAGDADVNLQGWYLTDDPQQPRKWTFPAIELEAGGYLVIFASGHPNGDHIDAGGFLHTNFRLSADGEFVGLYRPDLSLADSLAFPALEQDVGYGVSMQSTQQPLVNAQVRPQVLVPLEQLSGDWTGSDNAYDDSEWLSSAHEQTGIGYALTPDRPTGLVAEWLFETRDGEAVRSGQSAAGAIDETAGHDQGPYSGVAIGAGAEDLPLLHYDDDTPSGIDSLHALRFPAPENAANYVQIPLSSDDALAQLTVGDFRIETWFKSTDSGRSILVGSYVGSPNSLNLELHTANRGRIFVQGPGGTTDLNLTLPSNSRDGNWHHLAGVRRAGVVELYYDGQLVGSAPDVAGDYTIDKDAMYLGRDSRVTVPFAGSLDNVRLYNSADPLPAELVASYDFETVAGTNVSANQAAQGQVDDSANALGSPRHAMAFSAEDAPTGQGINYVANVPAALSGSQFALEIDEQNREPESFSVRMPPAIANLTLGDFTLQTWFNTRDTGRSILMGSYTGPDSALNFELHTSNRLRIYIQNANGGTTDLNVPVNAVANSRDGQWHVATAVRRGESVELYLNGTLVGQTSDIAGAFVQSAANYYFGRDSRLGETQFDGMLDEIRMWDVALSPAQIQAMANGAGPAEVQQGVFDHLVGLDLESSMKGVNASVFARYSFVVDNPEELTQLVLDMKYDDGFVAYLNGREIARRNAPDLLTWNANATADRDSALAVDFETVFRGAPRDLLRAGRNILAIHGLNADADADEFLLVPRLTGISTTAAPDTLRYFPRSTPGQPNQDGVEGFVAEPTFSVSRGFYASDDREPGGALASGIALETNTPGASIRYTLDGSWPSSEHGLVYTSPIMIDTTTTLRAAAFLPGYASSPTVTHTYLFLEDVIRQPRNPGANDPGDPTYPLPFPLEHQPGVAADYAMDPRVVNNPLYADTIIDDLQSIPTMSLVMDMDDIFDQPNGIWANSEQRGDMWERLTSVEYFDPRQPDQTFHLNSAIRMQGRASRVPSSSIKHGFRLIFKDDYGPEGNKQPTGGPTKLEFPLFEGSPVERFDTLILRSGYNYSYLHGANDQNIRAQYIRERFMRETQLATGNLAAHGSYVHLYVNGLYFGLFAPQERPDASFMAEHLGGTKDDYDVLSAGEVRDGNADAWNELLTRAAEDLSVEENYRRVDELLDIDNLIDYMIIHIWGGTTDWPAPGGQFRNWVIGRKRDEGAGFQFFVWDAEYSIQGLQDNRVNVGDANTPAYLYRKLRDNDEFRLRFADRVHRHFFNGGALMAEQNIARYAQLANEIDRAIVAESARWGDTRGDACNPCLRDPLWVDERDWVLNTYMPQRSEIVLDQFQRAGLYPDLPAPVLSQHGGELAAHEPLDILSPATDLYRETILVAPSATASLHLPADDALEFRWTAQNFETDETWFPGTTSIGFDGDGDYAPWIQTDLQASMYRQSKSAYLRVPFEFDTSMNVDDLQLRARYDDGFIAYINGVEVARSSTVAFGVPPLEVRPGSQEADELAELFTIDLRGLPEDLLVDGTNILAIHAINQSSGSVDFLFQGELVGRERIVPTEPQPIWYTTDGSDPRLPGGQPNPASRQFSGPLSLSTDTVIKARVFVDGQWSALTEATFLVAAPSLRISEIYYHPADPSAAELAAIPGIDADDFEFVEVHNPSSGSRLQLDGFRLSGGVGFSFPTASLAPGETAVIVEDEAAFRLRFGDAPRVLGTWSGRLSNDGEPLILQDARGDQVDEIIYDDAAPWPPEADGRGPSLNRQALSSPSNEPQSWRAASPTPGIYQPTGVPGDFDGSGTLAAADIELLFQQLRAADPDRRFDLNGDLRVDQQDRDIMILELLDTVYGDANLDGQFNTRDLVLIFQAGEYEDDLVGNSDWTEGDWNGDGEFTSRDLVLAFQNGGYAPNATPAQTRPRRLVANR